ncbi:type II toxin-antitoxin system VapC family toxin [Dendronalium sp. ChiSLP03b]|uniref:type II toxin-antitoxin system VapC family toxin n=1 Tax=Dendronalium sp. ChiSLP03b TaxID=3075381 RepID=UPI002AD4ED05|nr:type II toxin-antitoxin system VapC family toxin [Dendronalium sp. ChiSLP03b]
MYIPSRLAINRFESLPIQMNHVLQVASLPDVHRDPFDRILIAQSQVENLPIVTIDQQITQYLVQTIW